MLKPEQQTILTHAVACEPAPASGLTERHIDREAGFAVGSLAMPRALA